MKQVFDDVFDYMAEGLASFKKFMMEFVAVIAVALLILSYPLWGLPYYLLCRKRKDREEDEKNER